MRDKRISLLHPRQIQCEVEKSEDAADQIRFFPSQTAGSVWFDSFLTSIPRLTSSYRKRANPTMEPQRDRGGLSEVRGIPFPVLTDYMTPHCLFDEKVRPTTPIATIATRATLSMLGVGMNGGMIIDFVMVSLIWLVRIGYCSEDADLRDERG